MRFVHSADWQIDMKAAHVGEVGSALREERFEAARRVVKAADDFGADFILLAGDTFEDNGVDRLNVQRVADILASFAGAVYLIPGNHDPLVPGSVWEHPAWSSHSNLHVLTEPAPVEIEGGFLYPCPVFGKHSGKDPTSWIDAGGARGIKIGIAHGTVEGVDPDDRYYPIPLDAPARSGLDYLALGHWHSCTIFETGGAARMAYPGTHETTSFGERDSGHVLLVEIAGPGENPEVSREKTGSLDWLLLKEQVRENGDIARLREKIEAIGDPEKTLINLSVSGIIHMDEAPELPRLQEIVEARFFYGRIDSLELHPLPGDAELVESFPPGIMREAARRILELSDPSYAGGRPEGATPEVASMAILELYAIAMEVGQ